MSKRTRGGGKSSARKVSIIEILDSDEEQHGSKRRRGSHRGDSSSFEIAEKRITSKRWPINTTMESGNDATTARKGKKSKKPEEHESRESVENIPPNRDDEFDSDIQEVPLDQGDGALVSRETPQVQNDNNASLPVSTGRSSFWGRRKVWNIDELLAETQNIEPTAARNIVQLFSEENTIPFICRYRRDLVNQITPEQLRDIKNSYTEILNLRKKAETIVTQLEKENVITEEIYTEMMCAKSAEELEYLYAPYKPASKGSLAERAKLLGLEPYAIDIRDGRSPPVDLTRVVDPGNPNMDSVEKLVSGICHILSHNISKDTGVLEELRRLQKVHCILLKSSKAKDTAKENTLVATDQKGHRNDKTKFELYFNFQSDVRNLKPHQILAINRGEKLKCLTVKIVINDQLKKDLKYYVREVFLSQGRNYELRQQIFEKSFEECYSKKLQPHLSRQVRSNLNEAAKKAGIDVFANNLKQLLLMSPLKGQRILGIDPGFTNGCKLALISETADVLETGVIYPHKRNSDPEMYGEVLAKMLARHSCTVIALGNGTACRETEFWLSKLFDLGLLNKSLVRYSIISEQGASIYSCSEVAKKEFPDMDLNEISAVSIARRLNDPLSEYVKIEPRHIGVGMYQHDLNEKSLTESLNEVVSECVSYVGVDINTASLSVLKHVAGLSVKKAEKILTHRLTNGPFRTRQDLMKVKSIGQKTFVQCAGFVRIEPRSVGGTIDNLLDCTWVHPESYEVATKIISKCKLKLKDIGTPNFISKIMDYQKHCNLTDLAEEFGIPKERLEIVFVALQRKLFQDYRSDFDKRPLFKQGLARLTELSRGDVVTGAVSNITHFGAFVDIGVECDGLIHKSRMRNAKLNIGDRVTASIEELDVKRKRIGLRLEEMLLETDTSFTFA